MLEKKKLTFLNCVVYVRDDILSYHPMLLIGQFTYLVVLTYVIICCNYWLIDWLVFYAVSAIYFSPITACSAATSESNVVIFQLINLENWHHVIMIVLILIRGHAACHRGLLNPRVLQLAGSSRPRPLPFWHGPLELWCIACLLQLYDKINILTTSIVLFFFGLVWSDFQLWSCWSIVLGLYIVHSFVYGDVTIARET